MSLSSKQPALQSDVMRLAAVLALRQAHAPHGERLRRALAVARGDVPVSPDEASIQSAEALVAAGVRLIRVRTDRKLPHCLQWCVVQGSAPADLSDAAAVINSRKARLPDGTAWWSRATVACVRKAGDATVLAAPGPLPWALAAAAARRPLLVSPSGVPALLTPARRRLLQESFPRVPWLTPLVCLFAVDARRANLVRDRFIIAAARQVIVVALRQNSGMLRWLRARLRHGMPVRVVPGCSSEDRTDTRGNKLLIQDGAKPVSAPVRRCRIEQEAVSPSHGGGAPPSWEHLAHHTADQEGPWPDETPAAFLQSLVYGRADSRRDAFQTLLRIARTGRIRAGKGGLRQSRGAVQAVCMTENPPRPDDELHQFDSARGRWLFGPYAVCVRRSVLQAIGAAPVIHGDEEVWRGLGAEECWRFQLMRPPKVDRRREKEWRLPADLDLKALPVDAVFFVTRTAEEAAAIERAGPWSAWPISVCGRWK